MEIKINENEAIKDEHKDKPNDWSWHVGLGQFLTALVLASALIGWGANIQSVQSQHTAQIVDLQNKQASDKQELLNRFDRIDNKLDKILEHQGK
jgi:ligand-binding sensor protein